MPRATRRDEGEGGRAPRDHEWPGWVLSAALALLGLFLAALALAGERIPAALRPEAVAELDDRGRGVLLMAGVSLGAIAWGVLLFRRWAWWGGVGVGLLLAWPALAGLLAPLAGGTLRIRLLELAIVACLPYLWARRRDFGFGATRVGRPRGP